MYAEHREEAYVAGADAFLVKGCSAEELYEAIVAGRSHGHGGGWDQMGEEECIGGREGG